MSLLHRINNLQREKWVSNSSLGRIIAKRVVWQLSITCGKTRVEPRRVLQTVSCSLRGMGTTRNTASHISSTCILMSQA